MKSIIKSFAVYARPRIIAVAFVGFASGLPLALTLSTLSIWLAEEGISKTAIGLFALIGTPYTIKFLWAPLIDQINLPYFAKVFGRRRSWMIFIQSLLIVSILGLGASEPTANILLTAVFALLVSIFSASQDVVVDAYRVEILKEEEQGAGAAVVVFGYRIGMLVSGAGALFIATAWGWFAAYAVMAVLVSVGSITMLITGEPKARIKKPTKGWLAWVKHAVIDPFANFMARENWLLILLFILLYKFGDAFAGVMTGPFVIDMGFSKNEYAEIVKIYGLAALLIGSLLGGMLVYRIKILPALWLCGILQMLSNLMFVVQAEIGYNIPLLIATISVENLAAGMGTAAFVAYLSSLCNINYTATQYALLSSLASVGRVWLSSSSGWFVDTIGWVEFFILSTVIALPGLAVLYILQKR